MAKLNYRNKLTIYLLAAAFPAVFMGSTFTFTPFSCFENVKSSPGQNIKGEKVIEKEFKIGKGKKLEVDLKTGGSIEIKGWDKDVVHVKAVLDGRDWEDIDVDLNETSSGLSILSDYDGNYNHRSSDVTLEVDVPKEFNLELETMGGNITLNKINGEFNGKTMGGELDLSSLKGKIDLETMGGNIRLVDSDIDGHVKTMGGNVEIQDVTGDVNGSSMGGNVSLKNVKGRDGNSTKDKVIISSMGGNIDVDTAPSGADVNTMGGAIHINSAGKFVKAKTMGGNIVIKSVDGGVNAVTMGGDVEVKVTGADTDNKDISLTSMSGDIYLTVPADLSMDIEISLAYTNDHDPDDYSIESDFNIKQEQRDKTDYHKGSPRKYIYGTGKTGDGKNKVKIETINGNVILKRG